MAQMISGQTSVKTTAEFDYQGLRGTPYCVIIKNQIFKKERIYMLETKEKLYYPLAEWDEHDSDEFNKWYEYLLSINDKIRKERECLREQGRGLCDLDKIEQIVPEDIKMIKDLKDDDWSHL
ncbi:hypothetical protein MTBBW1_380002 [Desulfamplus magnetovallimortis]|uniref:Uncharacterized protein n=1 Tax=Desulfamplus magnetovallimortis TaxID=1246637 RepID=A0A1W1HGI2_9BACT|nr:hypothetical protein [Desulfamplus magnetovallimortis]SLM31589.1 hypothetical protein MTBBW1_380002 [Desulfamplus magnetovallimortis]